MQKRVVVLGGAGLIGTHLCLRLLDEGCEVFCVDTRDAADSIFLRRIKDRSGFRYVHHNIISGFGIRCDEIYNLASPLMLNYDRTMPVETLKTGMIGSINALEAARSEYAKILYTSSDDIYGVPYSGTFIEEVSVDAEKQALTEAKRGAEALHNAYRQEYKVDARIARIFNVYGTGADIGDQRVVMKMIVAALQNRDITIYGNGEQIRTFCWVGDIVDGIIRLMAVDIKDNIMIFNFGGDIEISIRALAEKIVSLTGSKSKIVHSSRRPGEQRYKVADISSAKRELGWTPQVSLDEGLDRTIEYTREMLGTDKYRKHSWVEIYG